MYRACAFCNGKLDGDGGPSGLGVGRRLAFDEWKGRLWVICPKCSRWNLAPLDERLERIEALARAAREGRMATATEQVALIRWHGYDLVGVFVWNMPRMARWMYTGIVGRRAVGLVEPPICERCGSVMRLRAKHMAHARVVPDAKADLGLVLSCPSCHSDGAMLTGPEAQAALRQGLTYLALTRRRGRERAEDAARLVEGAGGPERLIRDVARRELTLRSIAPDRRLALEMAVDEQAEVAGLERQWREAEEIAEIADGLLSTTAELEAELRRLKERGPDGGQPSG